MKDFVFRELDEEEHFGPLTLDKNTPFTQAKFYGNWQNNLGRKVKRFLIHRQEEVVAYGQLIEFPLIFGKNYLYLPYGPVLKEPSADLLLFIKQELGKIAKRGNAVFTRLDFSPPLFTPELGQNFTKAPSYTYHSAYFQPRLEWFLNLEKSETELYEAMNKKTRYAMRLAEKGGVTTEIVTQNFEQYFEIFYKLMTETARRDRFSLHPKIYYQNIFRELVSGQAYLALAKHGGKILAIDLIIVFGETANYVFGASSNDLRNLCASYLAKRESIYYAKKIHCLNYNFGGITSEEVPNETWQNLTTFKKRFGGYEVRHSDFFDLVTKPFWYHLYNLRKRLKKLSTG